MISIPVDTITELIQNAGRMIIMPRFGNLNRNEISTKSGPHDFVTTVDTDGEKSVVPQLLAFIPNSQVVGEEDVGLGAVPPVYKISFDAPVWTVDMLDGTEYFVNGDPRFASMISLNYKGETLAAWIHFPVSGLTIAAQKGAGAFIGDRKLSILEPMDDDLITGLVVMPGGHHIEGKKLLAQKYPEFFSNMYPTSNAATQYARLVTSFQPQLGGKTLPQYHFFMRLFGDRAMKPWDHLPGQLIAKEAGAKVMTLSKQKINMDSLNEGILIAAPAIWDRMHNATRGERLMYG